MSFLGQTRRRPINLGNKQQRTREDILKKAEEDRLQREVNRKQTDAAIVLQNVARSKLTDRKQRIKALRAFESKLPSDSNILVLDFIYICPVLDNARNPAKLIQDVQGSVRNDFLYSQLLIAFNTLWEKDSPSLELILELYRNAPCYPEEIVGPLHKYAKAHQSQFVGFFLYVFTQLARWQPREVFRCAISDDTLLNLGVDLSGLRLSESILESEKIPADRLISLLQNFMGSPASASLVIVQLVSMLPLKLSSESAQHLTPLFTREFVAAVLQLDLTSQQLAAFIAPLLSAPNKTQLLMHLCILQPNIISILWGQFSTTRAYSNAIEIANSGTSIEFSHQDLILFIAMLELYSYRLIICSDEEIFDILSKEDTINLAQILKGVCALICTHKFNALDARFKNILFAVTRQLHVRSERRNFLPANFWLISRSLPQLNLANLEESLALMDYDDGQYDDDDDDDGDEPIITFHVPPFIEVLKNVPFFVDFMTRASIFSQFIIEDKKVNRPILNTFFEDGVKTYSINRESMVNDTASAFHELAPDNGIKTKLKFTVYSNGEPEPGIDGGGLTKEVLTSVCQSVFVDQDSEIYSDLFIETPDHTLYPNPKYRSSPLNLTQAEEIGKKYQFLGLVIGKCLHESIMVDVNFSPFFLQKWAGSSAAKSSFDDFYLLDPDMYAGLQKLSQYTGNVEDLALDFTTDDGSGGIVELKANGADIAVTNKNKLEYIHLVSNYRLNHSIRSQTMWFLRGITYFISPNWLKMFSAREVQTLISGENNDFNIDDLRSHSDAFGFAMDHYVDYFWDVVRDMTAEERRLLLKFVTSVPRGPLLGFSKLNPRFALRSAGRTDERLPTASTCVNLLKLPEYSSREVLREKLLYAITSNAGFDLS